MPPETTNRGWYRGNSWYHTDQRLSDSSRQCIQSWVTALPVNEGDATLTVLVGSHKYHGDFAARFNKKDVRTDWYKLNGQEELDYFIEEKQCAPVSIACPAGSLVLWDSRTMHAGQESLKGRAAPNFRMIAYLCYLPRVQSIPRDLTKKQKAFNEQRMTSHWPQKAKLFGKNPQTYGAALPDITPLGPPRNVGLIGMKLAGF